MSYLERAAECRISTSSLTKKDDEGIHMGVIHGYEVAKGYCRRQSFSSSRSPKGLPTISQICDSRFEHLTSGAESS